MRPPSVYANPSCPAGCPCDLLALLRGPHRIGLRLVMILLSHHGLSAATIAELLGCDPATVRRWIHRYNTHGASGLGDRPRAGRPPLGGPRLPPAHPEAARPTQGLDDRSAVTATRPTRPQPAHPAPTRPAGRLLAAAPAVAKGDPDRDQVLADLHQQLRNLPEGAVVLAEDETHINLLPWVRAA
jgi:hypothetical protein